LFFSEILRIDRFGDGVRSFQREENSHGEILLNCRLPVPIAVP
jgi:hypothetical protein